MMILDVGCGGGGLLRSLEDYDKLFGLESSFLGATITAKRTKAQVVRGTAQDLPFREASFDVLTSLDVIEHLDDNKALKEFYRILANKGIIILTVPAFNFLWSPRDVLLGHKRRYTINKLRALLDQVGFKTIKCSYANSFYFPALLAYALFKKFFGSTVKPKTTLMSFPYWLARLFSWILKLEENILIFTNIPIGTSIVCIAKK